ncbi:MAG: hypothetical protein IJO60_02245 [Agathobacter sp.]|nr:hypothetical protein [Agathobacter sp.]
MSYTIKPFEELDIMDDFLISAAACDEEVGEEFSRTLVNGLLQRNVGNIQVGIQKVIFPDTPNQRGIRLDIEVNEYEILDEEIHINNIYDIEPNKRKDVNLPKHNRFYQAKIDSRNLKSGEEDFENLPNLFVIMITNYDPFGYDYMMYTIHNQCKEIPELEYEDGLMFLYFNTTGTKGGNSSIKSLLNFIQKSKIENVTDEVTKKLHDCISKVKVSPELRMEYMKWDAMIYYERRDAKNEGKIEGKIESILELIEEFGTLSDEIKEKILAETDLEQIKTWHKLAAKVNSIEEFISLM